MEFRSWEKYLFKEVIRLCAITSGQRSQRLLIPPGFTGCVPKHEKKGVEVYTNQARKMVSILAHAQNARLHPTIAEA